MAFDLSRKFNFNASTKYQEISNTKMWELSRKSIPFSNSNNLRELKKQKIIKESSKSSSVFKHMHQNFKMFSRLVINKTQRKSVATYQPLKEQSITALKDVNKNRVSNRSHQTAPGKAKILMVNVNKLGRRATAPVAMSVRRKGSSLSSKKQSFYQRLSSEENKNFGRCKIRKSCTAPEDQVALLCQLMFMYRIALSPDADNELSSDQFDPLLDCKHFEFYPSVFAYLRKKELDIRCRKNFLEHSGIKEEFRSLLIDWLIRVHLYIKCRTECVHLAVTLTDMFLSVSLVHKAVYQLVGITALFIACKVIQRSFPKPGQLCYLTDDCYSVCQLIEMERTIMTRLEWQINPPLATHFLHRALMACFDIDDTVEIECMCRFLLEAGILDSRTHFYRPSCKAGAALYLARYVLYPSLPEWSPALRHFTRCQPAALFVILTIYTDILIRLYSDSYKYKTVMDKYAKSQWLKVSQNTKLKEFAKSSIRQQRLLASVSFNTKMMDIAVDKRQLKDRTYFLRSDHTRRLMQSSNTD